MTACPVCNSNRAIGKVGAAQYYCWDCCIEFIIRGDDIKIFSVQPDGTLTLYLDPLETAAQ
ncbi:hypothetical protein [Pelosinus propionicus]|uniref:Uncharacterized protein n=1 Tax=Pelosinus propionicus DSM 13327 TaxID=1123291 RepID=A0A1I4KT62_9FIRM|nr:hypothetical protein [Pelosinus propionicus]SFL81587.1 hypothetical protein SAMN04490355_101968 [Pelosinus propionicus DSM 13327]